MKKACDACRRRKIKCDGKHPCTHCKLVALSCTYLAIPQRKGRKGEKANVISALRAAQARDASYSAQPDVLINLERTGEFIPKAGLLPSEMIDACTEFFFTRLLSTLPILDRQKFEENISRMNDSIQSYCLVASLCAFVIIQTGGIKLPLPVADVSQLKADLSHGRALLDEVLAARRQLDILAEPTFESVTMSFFLYCCHVGLGSQRQGWFFLREATTLYSTRPLKPDDKSEEAIYVESLWQNLYWVLLVSERSHAIRRYRPITLQITPDTPELKENISGTTGLKYLVELFRPFDDTFMALWNKADALCLPPSLVGLEQKVLAAIPASATDLSDDQVANLRVSQQWLRTMSWRLATSLGFLSSSSVNDCMTFRYPLQISKDLTVSTFKIPQQSMEVHGIGLTEKVYDVACTLTDVISCIPSIELNSSSFELGPGDYLNYFFSLIYRLRGGKTRFLPLLLKIVGQTLPALITPITQHLQIPAGISESGTSVAGSSLDYDETMFGFHDTEMSLWLEKGRISTDVRDRVERRPDMQTT
ncbi:hypothetical protein V1509DRAFT_654976 [Lipomyces kononenkoae]